VGLAPWGSAPHSFISPCLFWGVCRGPEAVAEGPLEGGLPLVLALETGERSAAGVEALGVRCVRTEIAIAFRRNCRKIVE
jgi:hypothetical protein